MFICLAQVHRGVTGAKMGMVFVYTAVAGENPCSSKYSWDCYDHWTADDYAEFKATQGSVTSASCSGPVAFFALEEDWDEVEVDIFS